MQVFNNLTTVLFILNIGIYCFGNQLERVKERIRYLEARINSESKFRDEDYANIIKRLDDLDEIMNASLLQRSEDDIGNQEIPEASPEMIETLKEDLWRIRKAFSMEKSENIRMRREIPKLGEGLSAVNQHVEKFCKGSLDSTKQMINRYEKSENSIVEIYEKIDELLAILKETKTFKFEELKNEIAENVKEVVVETILSEIRNISETVIHAAVDSSKIYIDSELERISKRIDSSNSPDKRMYMSCLKAKESGENENGVYKLQNNIEVYCDQVTDGGGWTVFQRRLTGEVDFYRNWNAYKHGFGNLSLEFWLGNGNLNVLTSAGNYELPVEMEDFLGWTAYATYNSFRIHAEDDLYKLDVDGYSGDAGDSLKFHNGVPFSTLDNDNDRSKSNCAVTCHGAWWYTDCHVTNLNGRYYNEPNRIDNKGITWYLWKNDHYCLKRVEMKFRENDI